MDLSSLTDEQLQQAIREEIQKYIDIIHSDQPDLPEDNIFKSQFIGEILREVRKRNKR